MDIGSALERVGKINLKGGVFGKLTLAVMAISILVSGLAYATNNIYVISATIVLLFAFAFYFLHRLMNFTEKNPIAAILDGSEFVAHERIIHAAKNVGILPPLEPTIDHPQPEIDRALVEMDDEEADKRMIAGPKNG